MGKGNRAHVDFQPALSSSDVLSSKGQDLLSPPPLHNPDCCVGQNETTTLEETPLFVLVSTYLSYMVVIVVGYMRDFFESYTTPSNFTHLTVQDGVAPLNTGFDTFYHRRLYMRIRDCFNRPTTKVPGRTLTLLERTSNNQNKTFELTGNTREVLNLSSYNYLGFAQNQGPCADSVELALLKYGVSSGSSQMEAGKLDLHSDVEKLVAEFVGKESSIVYSMGFATNSTTLPSLVGKNDLIISDELNHSSLVFGARISGASVRVFKHNDPSDLERVLRDAISQGLERTHRPWKKILVVLEGLYSMEGNICRLDEIVELKKRYKFYIYLDEAHSIGAMGPNGRGVCDYFGINPADIDVCMGTFTKSFGSAGGYIAADKNIIDHLRLTAHSSIYAESISVPVLKQIYSSMRIVMGVDEGSEGRYRIQTLSRNARFFASELRKMGFIVYGGDSPVIPLLLFQPCKIAAFSREMLDRGIAVVVVGHPATSIICSRVRFCISASHTMEDLRFALDQISEVGDLLLLKFASKKLE